MPHAHVYGRLAKMPGVTSTFTFRPAELSPRVRNSAKKMVQERVLRGGWSSQSRKVAKVMLNHARLPFAASGWRGLHVAHADPELRKELEGLVVADHAAHLLNDSYHPSRNEWADRQKRENLGRLRATPVQSFHLSFHSDDFRDRATEAVATYHLSRKDFCHEAAQRVCALLDDPNALIEVTPNLID